MAIPPPSLATSSAALSGLAAAMTAEMAPKNPLFPIAFKNDDRSNDGDDDEEGRISPGVESPSHTLNGGGASVGHKNNNDVESRLLLQGSIDSLRLRAKEVSAESAEAAVDVKASAAAGDA